MQFTIKTNKREEIIDITREVEKIVAEEGKKGKACLVYVPHTTCAVTINENYDADVHFDILEHLKKIVPARIGKHSEGNSDAHIKSSLLGVSQTVPIEDGKLQLGKWQGIGLCEFDGPGERKIIVKIL